MIRFEIRKEPGRPAEFSYDIKSLAQEFFPEKECFVDEREDWAGEEGYPIRCELDGEEIIREKLPPGYNKNTVKNLIYNTCKRISGRELPWGILTGIRPAKIALRMLLAGDSGQKAEQTLREEYQVSPGKTKLAVQVAQKEAALMERFDHENGYNIYIGIPFCPSICQYCTFSSFDYKRYRKKVDMYLTALEKEMAFAADFFSDRELHTIYVGGGTPTSLSEKELRRLMDMIHRYLPVEKTAEFTVEAGRPDSITTAKLRILKAAGVTRISINPQTMKQHTLDILGRKHTVGQVREAFSLARREGFDNINMDLILGLPEETEEDVKHTLSEVLKLEPDSVTVHTLVIKRASRMRREQMEQGGEIRPEDELIPRMQDMSQELLWQQGYEPYYMYRQKNKAGTTRNTNQENVAFAKPGKECLYNIFIMEELETIVALGCGGSTKQVVLEENRMERIGNVKGVEEYIARLDEMIERKRSAFAPTS